MRPQLSLLIGQACRRSGVRAGSVLTEQIEIIEYNDTLRGHPASRLPSNFKVKLL